MIRICAVAILFLPVTLLADSELACGFDMSFVVYLSSGNVESVSQWKTNDTR